MRLLHTSDWHLGRTLHGFSLRDAQESAVAAVVDLAVERSVDVVVVAGDVFDRAVPPVESIRLLNEALLRLDAAGITTIVIAGNHDSGDRLATYAALLRERVHLVGSATTAGRPIELADEFGPVLVYALPYLDPDGARHELAVDGEPLERSHAAVVGEALDRISRDLADRPGSPRAIVVGHAFVADLGAGSADDRTPAADVADEPLAQFTSTSERDLSVGGVQVVPSRLFAGRGLSYVALGHLHRPQDVRSLDAPVRYSGSLLRYSLSESEHDKSVTLVDLDGSGAVELEVVPVPQPRGMARLAGTLDELTGEAFASHRDDFVELVVTDAVYPERMHARLGEVFGWILVATHRPLAPLAATSAERGDARGRDPIDVMVDFFRKVAEREPSAGERDVLQAALEAAVAGGRQGGA